MNYHISDGTQRLGPFPLDQLLGRGLTPETLVWREGMPDWRPARDVPEVSSLLRTNGNGRPAPPPPLPPSRAHYPSYGANAMGPGEINSKKIAAGVCGILLGGFGIHKFILGFTGTGLIMLLATVLTCGFGAMVTSVVGLIEGIVYLTRSDQEFYDRYLVGKQNWF